MKYRIIHILAIALVLFLAGCKGSRTATSTATGDARGDKILAKNATLIPKYKFLSIKGKGKSKSETETLGFTYKINIAHDSLMWGSITKFGIEAFRLLATPDSVFILQKIEPKSLTRCDYTYFSGIAGFQLDFKKLEEAVTGKPIYFCEKPSFDGKSSDGVQFECVKEPATIHYRFEKSSAHLNQMEFKDSVRNVHTIVDYDEYVKQEKTDYASKILFELISPNKQTIELRHSKYQLNPDRCSFNFRVPDSYEQFQCGEKQTQEAPKE